MIQAPRRAALTTTKVPRFDGTTSWEQYHQVFEAIVRSNGWDNDTAALQLFSHLEGDALNVAHLVPLARRLSRSGLVDALTAHYGSPGRLADFRRQFDRTTRTIGEDPAIFALICTQIVPVTVLYSSTSIHSTQQGPTFYHNYSLIFHVQRLYP